MCVHVCMSAQVSSWAARQSSQSSWTSSARCPSLSNPAFLPRPSLLLHAPVAPQKYTDPKLQAPPALRINPHTAIVCLCTSRLSGTPGSLKRRRRLRGVFGVNIPPPHIHTHVHVRRLVLRRGGQGNEERKLRLPRPLNSRCRRRLLLLPPAADGRMAA